jgi:hypothetical protein
MRDTIAVASFVGDVGVDRVPTWGSRVLVKARVEQRRVTDRGAGGVFVRTATVVACEHLVGPRDRVWVPPETVSSVLVFPVGHAFSDDDARTPRNIIAARRLSGSTTGAVEFEV